MNEMNRPLVSIIMAVYNVENTLKAAIDSVIAQTYKNIELVIIDGGSRDNTIEIARSYGSQINYFTSEKDNGVYDAMNKGIKASKGDWLFFLGGDDKFYNDDVLSSLFLDTDLDGIDLLYGDVEFTSNGRRYGEEKNYQTLVEQNICHQAIFHHKDIFKKLGLFNTKYPVLADFEMNIRIFRDTELVKKYVPMIITYYNNKGMSSAVLDRYFHADMLKTFLEKEHSPFLAPQLQQYHFYHGIIDMYSKQPVKGLKHIVASWVRGRRKLFYFLFTFKFLLRTLTGDKISIKQGK
jgi:glycosyltransferase involved in cell wall biosynthesis